MHLCGRFNKLRDQFNNSTLNTPCASRTLHTTNSKTFTPSTRFPWLASELLHHALAFPPLREIPLSPSAPRICILLVGGKKEWRPNLKSRKRRFHRFQLQFQRRQTPRRAERRSGIWWRTRWRGDCSTSPPSRSMAVSQVYMITAPGAVPWKPKCPQFVAPGERPCPQLKFNLKWIGSLASLFGSELDWL